MGAYGLGLNHRLVTQSWLQQRGHKRFFKKGSGAELAGATPFQPMIHGKDRAMGQEGSLVTLSQDVDTQVRIGEPGVRALPSEMAFKGL